MTTIIETQCAHHLGDNIINFIFFYNIKDYIESNGIIIYYYCWKEYHKNLLDFKCSGNIRIFEYEDRGYILHQGGTTPHQHYIEDKLCGMFNIFLNNFKIPISVNSFEYKDDDLFKRYENMNNKYKNINILIINSHPRSGQYNYDKLSWDDFIIKLSKTYTVATSEKVNDDILSLHDVSVKNIAAISLNVQTIISINTGPFIPLFNTDILNNIKVIFVFGGGNTLKTRKMHELYNIEQLSFLL
jgi:hypothetical protein